MTQSKLSKNLDGPALFQPKAKKDKMKRQVIRYSGKNYLMGIPTHDNLVTENNEGLTAILEDALSKHQDIPFMAIDVQESTEFTNGQAWYVLRLYGPFINGQKAVVSITGIQVFFNILVPDEESTDTFEAKIRGILSNAIKSFEIEHIKTFPFRGYHAEKKSYLRIYA
ncbi:13624_t:CDS:1, partial [Dentiscutata erythropus]